MYLIGSDIDQSLTRTVAVNTWADEELEGLSLGDARLDARLKRFVERMALFPELSISALFEGGAGAEAAYRLLSNAHTTAPKVLQPHYDSTVARAREHKRVLVLGDTTEYDFSRYRERVGGSLNGGERRGFLNHVLLSLTEDGVPLGLIESRFWTRPVRKAPSRKHVPSHKKESYRWLQSYEKVCAFKSQLPASTQVISITDSEGDIYECLAASRKKSAHPRASIIVRAYQDRTLANSKASLFEKLAKARVRGTLEVHVQPQRAKSYDGLRRKSAKVERDTIVTVRACSVELAPPKHLRSTLPNTRLNAVLAKELNPPKGEHPIEWLLLTDLPITTWKQVQEVILLYRCRWQVEVYFKTLKSVCKVEDLQLETDNSLLPCIAAKQIVAWRVQYITMLARHSPKLPCDKILEAAEWQSVYTLTQKKPLPRRVPTVFEILGMIASLGGYRRRKGHEQPGPKAVWIGIQRMRDLAIGWQMGRTDRSHRKKICGTMRASPRPTRGSCAPRWTPSSEEQSTMRANLAFRWPARGAHQSSSSTPVRCLIKWTFQRVPARALTWRNSKTAVANRGKRCVGGSPNYTAARHPSRMAFGHFFRACCASAFARSTVTAVCVGTSRDASSRRNKREKSESLTGPGGPLWAGASRRHNGTARTSLECTLNHNTNTVFLHERLEAYAAARRFYRLARAVREQLPRGLGEVRDQLYRAASSVSLAIAEGANASQPKIKALHFSRALASGGECAAALDQVEDESAAPAALLAAARDELRQTMRLTLGLRR